MSKIQSTLDLYEPRELDWSSLFVELWILGKWRWLRGREVSLVSRGVFDNLHFKIASGVIGTIVLLAGFDLWMDYRSYRHQLFEEMESSAADLSMITLQSLLELAMLGEHPELLQNAIVRLSENSPAEQISLLDMSGEVRFSSQPGSLGRRFSLNGEGCKGCHTTERETVPSSIFHREQEEEFLRKVTLVPNRQECHQCHDSTQDWNGVLIIDFPTSRARAQLKRHLNGMLAKGGLIVIAVLLVLGLLMNKVVIGRIHKLTQATKSLAHRQEVPELYALKGGDEIGQLAQSFGRMAEHLTGSLRELESQRAYLQDLIDSLQDGLVVVDREMRIELANQTALQTWGRDDLVGLSLRETALNAAAEIAFRTLQTGELTRKEAELGLHGEPMSFEIYCSPVWGRQGEVLRVIVLFRDVTERKLFERQINRAERLASVGQLAAGVAHEINNPMAAITTCAEGLERYLDSDLGIAADQKREVQEYLTTIGEAASRCKEITQRLLSVSADEAEVGFQVVDLAGTVREVVTLVGHEAEHRNISFQSGINGQCRVLGDPKKLAQLLLNLILNSMEAVSAKGQVKVSVGPKDDFVEIRISDNGCGIPEAHLDRIFDPFFTTKREGRGTGLGLSICEGIVRQHQGRIYVRSEEGIGTDVAVLLPSMEVLEE